MIINILACGNKWGKEQPISEPVLTVKGWKKMGDIGIGDTVFSQYGKKTKVIGVYPQGKKPVYRITFDDGSWTRCGLDHLWKVKDRSARYRNGEWKVLSTRNIIDYYKKNKSVSCRMEIPMCGLVDFPNKKTILDPYQLGLLLGDGGLTGSTPIFSTADIELLKNFEKVSYAGKYDWRILGIVGKIRKLGLKGKNSHTKFIPKNYLYNSPSVRLAVLRGLMDTDGSIDKDKKKIEITTASKKLAEGIIFLVQSLGGKTRLKNKGKFYRIIISMGICPFKLKRKALLFHKKKNKRTLNRIIYKIKSDGYEQSQCIAVNHPSHLYITRNFILTHNTLFAAVRHIHKNFYKLGNKGNPNEIEKMEYQTLVTSPVGGQAMRTKQYIEQILNSSFSWDDPVTGLRRTNQCKIGWFFLDSIGGDRACVRYKNGSRTDIRSIGDDKGSKLQGNDWHYISYDEYTRSYHLEAELEGNILPRLVMYGGNLDLIGTPDKDSASLQYVYDLSQDAQDKDSEYYWQGGSMFDNIFVSEKNKKRLVKGIKDKDTIKQVVEGEMLFLGGKVFNAPTIHKLWLPDEEWIDESEWREKVVKSYIPEADYADDFTGYFWKLPEIRDGYKIGKYLIAMDWHLSEGGDETVFYVIRYDIFPFEIVYYLATKRGNPYVKHNKARNLHKIYNNASLVVDSQGVGKQLSWDLEDLSPVCFDSVSAGKEKKTMVTILKNYLTYKKDRALVGKFRCPKIKELSRQLGAYKEDDKKIKQDHVMTLGVAAWWIENEGMIQDTPEDSRY